ncbi:MAG TPA: hypothetical protein VGO98_00155 [Candidatus Saccharimonadales bacterium]|jgi:hypothetical protein|nr:hypothetical protein [Candidatus Saccharimonadales bacterium]
MQLNKFTNNIDDPIHTNAFAAVVKSSGGTGATGPHSFSRRLHIERNRQNVNRYHDSMIANGHHREREQHRFNTDPFNRTEGDGEDARDASRGAAVRRPGGRLISDIVRPVTRPKFSEPPTRGFNPYK